MLRRISKAQKKMVVVPSILAMAVIVFLVMSLLPAVADAQKNNKDSEPTDAKNTKTAQSTTANNDDTLTTAAKKKKKAAEFAKGTGASGPALFSFNAKAKDKDPATDKATGTFSLTQGNLFAKGKLSCLRTKPGSDSIANFAGTIEDSNVAPAGTPISFDATDVSTGGDKLDITVVSPSSACHDPTGGTEPIIGGGGIVIHPLKP
jgi:hypothetical protein